MTDPASPRTILLATDLSHRCDRALDRAVQLARNWKARLLVVHAVEEEVDPIYGLGSSYDLPSWRRPPDPVRAVRDHLYQDLLGEGHALDIDILVEAGDPATIVLAAAARTQCDLIVTGVARDETLGRLILGNTVDRLARRSSAPLLVVRERPFRPYDRLLVATDFSPSARLALETAIRFFPDTAITLFHAYDVPFAGYLGRSEVEREFETFGIEASDKFLQEAGVPQDMARQVVRLIEHGVPEALLCDYAKRSRHHLTVVGSHGGGLLYDALVGSTARKIIAAVPGDVLLVPDAGRRKA
jgi:nucleotide-binding universal stress UspA family protein